MTKSLKSYEFEGATVEDAIEVAIESLKVSREMLKIKVLCEEQGGLFGMEGLKMAKIKVEIKSK